MFIIGGIYDASAALSDYLLYNISVFNDCFYGNRIIYHSFPSYITLFHNIESAGLQECLAFLKRCARRAGALCCARLLFTDSDFPHPLL